MMRTYFTKDYGVLECKDRRGRKFGNSVHFPKDSLLDWYPLDVSYEYRYDIDREEFFLAPLDYSHPRKYGITKRRRTSSEQGIASFKPEDKFYVEAVKEDNKKVLDLAEELDMPRYEDRPSSKRVREAYLHLKETVDEPIKEMSLQRAYEMMDEDERRSFLRSEEESRDVIVYKYATNEEKELLRKTGGVRVLLSLMRKEAETHEL